ncbi:hypothetical protein LCGC14_2080760 [marine sediment metagenome]|uniref:NlpC/P60 domain-containing protein n=1 Tax=marine sediment metagenome TaxID=412755 RepID=A0A0F9GU21_9ZZZZ
MMEQELRRKIVEKAREMIGTPYAHQHRTRRAMDCIGLVIVVGVEAEVMEWSEDSEEWRKFKNYNFIPDMATMKMGLETFLHPLPMKSYKVGDMIWLRDLGHARHLGIVTSARSYVHALRSEEKVIESILTPYVKNFIRATFRYPLLQEAIDG